MTPDATFVPRLNPDFEPLVLGDGSLVLLQRSGPPVRVTDPPDLLAPFLDRADGALSVADILAQLAVPDDDPRSAALRDAIGALARQGVVEPAVPPPAWFTGALAERFASWVDYLARFATDETAHALFRRLRDSHVAIIGLGGAGSAAAVSLTAAGIGRLTLVDGDRVESSNLIRQPFYSAQDARGRRKADAMAAYLAGFSSFTSVATVPDYIASLDDARRAVAGADFVLLCADAPRFVLNRWINEACVGAAIPYLNGFHRRVGPLCVPGRTPCFECYESYVRSRVPYHDLMVDAMQRPPRRRAPSSLFNPVLTGLVQANECIGFLSKAWSPGTDGRCANLGEHGVVSFEEIDRWPSCGLCGSQRPLRRDARPFRWDELVPSSWARRAAVLRRTQAEPIVDEAVAMVGLHAAFERMRAGCDVPLRLFFGDRPCTGLELLRWAPQAGETSAAAYAARIQTAAGAESVTLVLNGAHVDAPALWQAARAFLAGLYDLVGEPARVDAVLYLSTARSTCFGVHSDPYDNFVLPLAGAKTFRVWAERAPSGAPFDPEARSVPHAQLSASVGDALYIPAEHPHVAVSGGEAALHLSLAIDRRGRGVRELAGRELAGLVSELVSDDGDLIVPERVAALAESLASAAAALSSRLIGAMLRIASAGGFHEVPPPREAIALDEDQVVVATDARWLRTRVVGDELVCAANGHAFSLPAHPDVVRLFAHLGSGAAARVGELLDAYAVDPDVDRGALSSVLSLLYAARALETSPGGLP